MAKRIERFEDFIAWQKARKLTSEIYMVTNQDKFARDLVSRIRLGVLRFPAGRISQRDLNEEDRQSFISSSQSRKHRVQNCARNSMWLSMSVI
jgi:hypothetical protein